MPRVTYETPDGTAHFERDDVTFKRGYIAAYDNPNDERGIRNKKRVPIERVVEVDG
jgi:hypothetical protein